MPPVTKSEYKVKLLANQGRDDGRNGVEELVAITEIFLDADVVEYAYWNNRPSVEGSSTSMTMGLEELEGWTAAPRKAPVTLEPKYCGISHTHNQGEQCVKPLV